MRVAIVSNRGRSLLNFQGRLISTLRAQGHEVHALAPDDTPGLAAELAARGVHWHPISMERTALSPMGELRTVAHLVSEFRKIQPDRVFVYTIKPVIWGSVAARLAGVPHVTSQITGLGHVFVEQGPKMQFLRPLICALYRVALGTNASVLFLNPDDQDHFRSLGLVDGQDHLLAGSGVDLRHFVQLPILVRPVTFLYMGRFLREKGVLELIEAARRIKARHPDVRVRLLGMVGSNPSAIPESEVVGWRDEGLVELIGWAEDVRPHLGTASVLVLPSYREGSPRSILEAMAVGRPVIASDVPGCRQAVQHNKTGLLVPPADAGALADAMEQLIADPNQLIAMGEAARAFAESTFDIDRINRSILRLMALDEAA